jgi:hypothetical protein
LVGRARANVKGDDGVPLAFTGLQVVEQRHLIDEPLDEHSERICARLRCGDHKDAFLRVSIEQPYHVGGG